MSADNKKRKVYDLETKEKIIDDFHKKTLSVEEIMKKYEIKASSSFYTIIKNEEKIK
jgi:hypothetical protein